MSKHPRIKNTAFSEKKAAIHNMLLEQDASISDISIKLLLHPETVRSAILQLMAEEKVQKLDDGWKTQYTAKTKGRVIRLTDTRHNQGGTIGTRSDPIHRRTIGRMI